MSRIGKLEVELFANTSNLISGMKSAALSVTDFGAKVTTSVNAKLSAAKGLFDTATKSVLNLKSAVVGVGVAIGAFKAAQSLNAAAEAVDNLGKKGKTLDVPIQQLSIYRFTAQESGVEFETLATLVGKAQKNIGEFSAGTVTPASKAFQELGIKIKDARGEIRPIGDLLPEIGDKLQDVSSQSRKISLASQIFGKEGGTQFVQILQDVDGRFSKMIQTSGELAANLGVVYNDEQFRRLKNYNDAVGRIGIAWEGVKVKVLSEVAPVLADFANELALDIAKIPSTIGAVANAAKSLFNQQDPRNGLAAQELEKFQTAVGTLLVDSATDAGKAFVLTAAEGLVTAAQIAGLSLYKAIFDSQPNDPSRPKRSLFVKGSLGDTLFSSESANAGNQAEVDRLQKNIDTLKKLNEERSRVVQEYYKVRNVSGDTSSLVKRKDQILASADPLVKDAGAFDIDSAIKVNETKLKAAQAAIAADAGASARQIAQIIQNGFGNSGPVLEELKAKTIARFKDVGDALTQIRQDFSTDFVGPPAPEPQRLGKYFDAALRIFDRFQTGVSTKVTAVGADWEKLRKLVTSAGEESLSLSQRLTDATIAAPVGDNIFKQQLHERTKLIEQQRVETEKFLNKYTKLSGTIDSRLLGQLTAAQRQEFKNLTDQQTAALKKQAEAIRTQFDPRIPLNQNLEDAQGLLEAHKLSPEDFTRYSDTIKIKIKEIETGLTNFGDQFRDAVKGWGTDAANAFADVALGAKVSFKSIAESWAKTLISLTAKQYIFQPLANALGNIAGSLLGGTPTLSSVGGGGNTVSTPSGNGLIRFDTASLINTPIPQLRDNAHGNAFVGGLEMFAHGGMPNHIASSTAIFPMRNGKIGVYGEKGPEYAAQVARMSDGNLGLRMAGGGGGNVQVNIIDQRGSNAGSVETQQRTGPGGSRVIDVFVREAVGRMAQDGSLDKVLGASYGVKRTGTRR